MKSVSDMSPEELAGWVCQALSDAGIRVTLSGGACVAIWSNGKYESRDIDFIEQGFSSRQDIAQVLGELGFRQKHRYFEHPDTEFLVEFPSGPLAVGDEPVKQTAERETPTGLLRLLTPTDCVKDRLAAYFHWNDRQALEQAVMVANAQAVNLDDIRRWATAENMPTRFADFFERLATNQKV